MDQQKIIASYETRARLAGSSIREACQKAYVAPSTFFRWKKTDENPNPTGANLKTLNRIDASLKAIERKADKERREISMQAMSA